MVKLRFKRVVLCLQVGSYWLFIGCCGVDLSFGLSVCISLFSCYCFGSLLVWLDSIGLFVGVLCCVFFRLLSVDGIVGLWCCTWFAFKCMLCLGYFVLVVLSVLSLLVVGFATVRGFIRLYRL